MQCFFYNAVIGFSPNNLTLDEECEQMQIVKVKALTSASDPIQHSTVDVTIDIDSAGLNPTIGWLNQHYIYMYTIIVLH